MLLALALALGGCGSSSRATSAGAARLASYTAQRSYATQHGPLGAGAASGHAKRMQVAAPCGASSAETLARADGRVALSIYRQELSSSEVRSDQRQVEGYGPLLRALAAGDRAATSHAVTQLVYSHTHLVRLRVTSRSGTVTDVGGPYIIAPVGGLLRLHGRTVGRYQLSVQDDIGYVKLAARFIGDPVVIESAGRRLPLEGTTAYTPGSLPEVAAVSYRGAHFEAFTFRALAFPSGSLQVTLLASAAHLDTASSCAAIASAELARIGARIWRRYVLASAPPAAYVRAIANLTGGLAYIRAGARLLAGSRPHVPAHLPAAGSVRYAGLSYRVSSFRSSLAGMPVRVYLLFR